MSQISPPIRILLVGAVVLAAAWVLVLKPKPADTTAAAPAPVSTPAAAQDDTTGNTSTKLGAAVEAAKGASDATDATNAATGAATGDDESATVTKPSTAGAAAPAATTAPQTGTAPQTQSAPATTSADPALEGLPKWTQDALGKKVIAVLFWNKDATDDRRTHDALKDAYKADGGVVTRSVPVTKIADYGKLARGVDVSQSPTLMIIDRDKNATALVGYSNLDAINQAIIDARLATDDPSEKVAQVEQMDKACSHFMSTSTISSGDTTPSDEYRRDLKDVSAGLALTLKDAPKSAGNYGAQLKLLRSYVKSEQGVVSKIKASALGQKVAPVNGAAIRKAQATNDKLEAKASLQLNAIGVDGCN